MSIGSPLVIVGASCAGTQLAASARENGFDAPIILLGDEAHTPYQRPPLSKGLLTGKASADAIALRGPDFFTNHQIDLRLGTRAVSLDARARRITLADGSTLDYGWLALATGARCRTLAVPGAELQGVHQLRTLDDALGLAAAMPIARAACVIGGGFIGLEAAAALAGSGIVTTVVEFQPRLLARSATAMLSDHVAAAHRQRGVTVHLGHGVRALHGSQGRVEAVELDDGRRIECDLVVLGVGVQPNVELAQAAGADVDQGIVTDALGRTSLPHVLAAGDVANMAQPAVPGGPARMRLESIQAANDGARAAASLLVEKPQPLSAVPWFWSDQFDLKFQMAGLPMPGDDIVLRGAPETDRFSIFHLRDGRIVASQSVNRPSEHMQSRKLIAAGARTTADQLRDESFDLKTLVPPTRLAGQL